MRASRNGEARVVIEVTDTGPGIDPKILPKLFEPFTMTRPDGTGLGLSIVHSVVEEHRDQIYTQNQPGQGATFTVRLTSREQDGDDMEKPDACLSS